MAKRADILLNADNYLKFLKGCGLNKGISLTSKKPLMFCFVSLEASRERILEYALQDTKIRNLETRKTTKTNENSVSETKAKLIDFVDDKICSPEVEIMIKNYFFVSSLVEIIVLIIFLPQKHAPFQLLFVCHRSNIAVTSRVIHSQTSE